MRLTHVRLLAENVGLLTRFYRDLIGLEVTLEISEGFYVELAGGGVVLSIYQRDLMESITGLNDPTAGDRAVLCFEVDDVDAAYRSLVDGGATSVRVPHDQEAWFLRVAHVRDPEGNLLELNKSTYSGD